jgi:UDP-N-acetyl-alpha-D-muramoyl-L-alanyl-L-glutamate epimerase
MKKINRSQDFNALRKEFRFFVYENFFIESESETLKISFLFNLSDKYFFRPTLTIPTAGAIAKNLLSSGAMANLVFHIGMVELISYWKAACPHSVIIKPACLPAKALRWWKKNWFNGLGEFFFLNGIETNEDDFLEIKCHSGRSFSRFNFDANETVMVPVGGGKDSVVTIELLQRSGQILAPFILNPRSASWDTLAAAGIAREHAVAGYRTIDPLLPELNAKGFLNGHTPFSALLAFVSLLAGGLQGIKHIALSNEASANEATIPGTDINHQYSKSFQFEMDFRSYVDEYISPGFNYFSFLRPLNELQIAALFTRFPQHFSSFRSCNTGSKTNIWCGKCPKCLFTAIILAPFLDDESLKDIFKKSMLDDSNLKPFFDELTGTTTEKPFECVGTIGEVNAAVEAAVKKRINKNLPALFSSYKKRNVPAGDFSALMADFNHQHFLNDNFLNILKKAVYD